MNIESILGPDRGRVKAIAARHGAGRVWVFGSVARGDASADSDLDLLVEVTGKPSPWFPGGLVAELESLLGRRVDVVEREALQPSLRDRVIREAVLL
jgi:uncharacterized protein